MKHICQNCKIKFSRSKKGSKFCNRDCYSKFHATNKQVEENRIANPVGRPVIDIDIDKLQKMVAIQCTANECACFFECSVDTLDLRIKDAGYENFTDYFKRFSGTGKISLRRLQFKAAQKGNITMLIWLGKQWLGQADKIETYEHDDEAFGDDESLTPDAIDDCS